MHHQAHGVETFSEDKQILENICFRLSRLEKSSDVQSHQLNKLQDATEETCKRVSILYESVANKEKIMEARARICSDRVFLIEAAAGRKDDVYNAIESLFKCSQKNSERLNILEKSMAEAQGQAFGNVGNIRETNGCVDDGLKYEYNIHQDIQYFPQKKIRRAIPPSRIVNHICGELYDSISLPGVRFVGQGKNWFHRYLWVILHLTTFAISFNYIKEAYDTWQNSPVVLSLNNSMTRVADVPFPAITLCSLPSVSNDYNITQQLNKCIICTNDSIEGFCQLSDDCTYLESYPNATPSNSPSATHQYSCEHVQTSTMEFSDTPVCLTFNGLCPNDLYRDHVVPATLDERHIVCKKSEANLTWTTDTMMVFANKNDSIPLYREKQIEILFTKPTNLRMDTCNNGNDANSKIGLHHPGEVPMEENTRFYSFRTDRDINIYIQPSLITAQTNLRHYEPSVRGCYFSYEKNLTLFKFYTRKNCQMECKANCSLEVCQCIPNFLPRHNTSLRICHTEKDDYCIQYTLSGPRLSSLSHSGCQCDCLPDCTSLSYDLDIDDVEIDPELKNHNLTMITIRYKDLEFTSKLRYELRNFADFVADSGGFLGVFNGFSFMVVCELFYFLTVRLWSSIKKNWRLAAEEGNPSHQNFHNSF